MFFKSKVKNGKHVYNIENLNIKTNLYCMAFTSLFFISSSSFTMIICKFLNVSHKPDDERSELNT